MKSEITIRTAVPDDAAELLDIYAYYVEKTAITFEYDVPSLEEFRGRAKLRDKTVSAPIRMSPSTTSG